MMPSKKDEKKRMYSFYKIIILITKGLRKLLFSLIILQRTINSENKLNMPYEKNIFS